MTLKASSSRINSDLRKRFLDIILALSGIVVLSPILLILMILVRSKLGSPVFFVQQRPGMHGKPFRMIKFRTMLQGLDAQGKPLADEHRITPFGNILRRSSLDELPELFNVLRGDMSLVGPRPLLMEYLELYTTEQARRHEVKPGITGWAQINGRNAISWESKFALDIWYIDNWSLWLDIKILFLTVFKVFGGKGIGQRDDTTTDKFRGN